MEKNPKLRNIQANFWGDPFILKLQTRMKNRGWMEAWRKSCHDGAPDWNILQEAVTECQRFIRYVPLDSDWQEPLDPVFVLYQFLRARLGVIR